MGVASIIGGGLSLAGALSSSKASKKAASQQSASDAAAIAEQRRQFDAIQKLESPFVNAGTNSTGALSWLLGLGGTGAAPAGVTTDDKGKQVAGPAYSGFGSAGSLTKPFTVDDFHTDPGYEFALQQGQAALQRTQSANGNLSSGAAAKAINDYSMGQANQQYGAAYDRYNTNQSNLYNRLMGLTNVGQAAASNQASAGQNMANNVSDLMTNQGNSNAAGTLGQNAAWSTGLSSIASAFGGGSGGSGGGGGSGWYSSLNNPGTSGIAWN